MDVVLAFKKDGGETWPVAVREGVGPRLKQMHVWSGVLEETSDGR